jgi:hypothetical protein
MVCCENPVYIFREHMQVQRELDSGNKTYNLVLQTWNVIVRYKCISIYNDVTIIS